MSRKAGILLPIFSLPSEYGIGTLGRAAYRWVDFLNGMSNKALMRASNHFARLGIEIIWADDFNEIPRLLRRLLIKRFDSFKSEKAKYYNPQ